jgi:flagellar capping protein FliD
MSDKQVTFTEVIADLSKTLVKISVRLDDIGADVVRQFDAMAKKIADLEAQLNSAVEQIPPEE